LRDYFNVKNYARVTDVQELPSLIEIQSTAFDWFINEGLLELFDEINPIESFNGSLRLYFPGKLKEAEQFGLKYWFEEPKYSQELCLERDMSYAKPMYVRVALVNKELGDEVTVSDIFMGEFPIMTKEGTFIINGTERVVVSQLIRSQVFISMLRPIFPQAACSRMPSSSPIEALGWNSRPAKTTIWRLNSIASAHCP